MPKLKNYTTQVSAGQTVGEIQSLLAAHGITSASVEYADGRPVCIKFAAFLFGAPRWFAMGCDAESVLLTLKRHQVQKTYQNLDHAAKVGWRIILNAIEAQLALATLHDMSIAQVFFGFAIDKNGRTAYEVAVDSGMYKGLLNEQTTD